ncbi:MAG: BCCT family transporter [Verrucomicrobiota bacterium]|nr:BCCT family transporter [Verrucomicrobiota bacterium]
MKPPQQLDRFVFSTAVMVFGLTVLVMLIAPQRSQQAMNALFDLITGKFGGLYLWFGIGTLAFLLLLACSPFGAIPMGRRGEGPEHSTLSWIAMLFSTGIGTTVLYWGTVEWMEYYQAPPFGLEPASGEAMQWARAYGMFHWGPIGWGFYCLPAVCLAYGYHLRGDTSLRLSTACRPLLGSFAGKLPGRIIDILFMVGLLGSSATGIGLTTPLITESFCTFFDVPPSFGLTLGSVILVVLVVGFSVYSGLEKGIKQLSNVNMWLLLLLLLTILLFGPSLFILERGAESLWFMIRHLPEMSGLGYPEDNRNFTEAWTVFYWAWWLAFGPFVGMFICKVSRGRTLRQIILGVLFFGTLGCVLCFVVMGGYAQYLDVERDGQIMAAFNESPYGVVIQVVVALPLGKAILPLFFLLCTSFAATTYDSASYTLASATTLQLDSGEDPPRWLRVFWAAALGILPLVILSLGYLKQSLGAGVLKTLQTASVVVSLPMLLISLAMAGSLLISLRRHSKKT